MNQAQFLLMKNIRKNTLVLDKIISFYQFKQSGKVISPILCPICTLTSCGSCQFSYRIVTWYIRVNTLKTLVRCASLRVRISARFLKPLSGLTNPNLKIWHKRRQFSDPPVSYSCCFCFVFLNKFQFVGYISHLVKAFTCISTSAKCLQ